MDETQHRVGDYTIVRKLGEGGMGAVYLATDLRLGRPVALKMLRPELAVHATDRERFLREARVAAAVEHDNLVPVWDIDETADGTPFIAMPFLKGESLDARLRRAPAVPLDLVLKVAEDVASGLAAAHAVGLIHRDIKPANIWLEGDPRAPDAAEQVRRCKVLDFGLARFAEPGDAQITGSGVVLGTPAYMAPEQAHGERIDHRADLFSLGVVLYRMATGQPPFKGDTPLSVLIALTTETPALARVANPNLPPDLADLIDRLLNKAPGVRPQSAAEVVRAARAIRAQGSAPSASFPQLLPLASEESSPDTVLDVPVRRPARGRWAIAALVCVLLLAPLGAWLAGAFDGKQPDAPVARNSAPQQAEEQPKPVALPPIPVAPEPRLVVAGNGGVQKLDPDRTAALWVIGLGGVVCVDDEGDDITSAKDLPTGPFRLTAVMLTENAKVTDDQLVALGECRHLTVLGLSGTRVGDPGLTHLKECRALMYVYLNGTQVTSSGLGALRNFPEVLELDLSHTRVDDEGLKLLARPSKVGYLTLTETQVTPAGVAALARVLPGCQITWAGGVQKPDLDRKAALWVLSVGGSVCVNGDGQQIKKADRLPNDPFSLTDIYLTTPVKDEELEALAGCKSLANAYLVGTGITDGGLVYLKGCKNLTSLFLSGTKVGDESVAVIKGLTKLADLSVGQTAFTDKGVKQLAKALPKCRIQHDGGTIAPSKK